MKVIVVLWGLMLSACVPMVETANVDYTDNVGRYGSKTYTKTIFSSNDF
jgi:hypothetical protein